uniref:NADH-ubiquinone oxidoreductase chain 6 n=1 Tax=Deropeltis paulinoi TaxID=2093433 RepID=A0A2P1H873_9NEOP|nr:NADH dehydrogenase subunit 6 [Deropeltis paulinoi]
MMILMMITSLTFMQMKHPMAIGMMLLIQTINMCMMSGLMSQSFWFSYVLFLIFLGGMLVLFIYITSLASNEMFYMSMKLMLIMMMLMILLYMLNKPHMLINNMEMMINQYMYMLENETTNLLLKLYNQPTNLITIMLASYLFLTMIVVVKITNISKGPLRQMN